MLEWFPHGFMPTGLVDLISLLSGIFALIVAFLTFQNNPSHPVGRRISLFFLIMGLWLIVNARTIFLVPPKVDWALGTVHLLLVMTMTLVYLRFAVKALNFRVARKPWFDVALLILMATWLATYIALPNDSSIDDGSVKSWFLVYSIGSASVYAFTFIGGVLRWRHASGALRRQYGLYSLAFGLFEIPAVVGLSILTLLFLGIDEAALLSIQVWLNLVWAIALAVMIFIVAYAGFRHQFFDADMHCRIIVKRGTVAGFFLALFIVTTVLAENFLTEQFGWAVGGLVAGILIFAIRPFQQIADRFAAAAIPRNQPVESATQGDLEAFYQEQVEIAMGDGQLSPKELVMLDSARERLGLSAAKAQQIHRSVAG